MVAQWKQKFDEMLNSAIFRANFYCNGCHEDITDENLIRRCMCKHCKWIYSLSLLENLPISCKILMINKMFSG